MIQEQFNYIRITYSRDLAEAEGFAWYEAPEKPLNRNTVFFLSFTWCVVQQLLLRVCIFSTIQIIGRH